MYQLETASSERIEMRVLVTCVVVSWLGIRNELRHFQQQQRVVMSYDAEYTWGHDSVWLVTVGLFFYFFPYLQGYCAILLSSTNNNSWGNPRSRTIRFDYAKTSTKHQRVCCPTTVTLLPQTCIRTSVDVQVRLARTLSATHTDNHLM